jgi:purine nucleosidase
LAGPPVASGGASPLAARGPAPGVSRCWAWLTTAKRTTAFRNLGSKVGVAVADMLEFFERFDEQKYGTDGGPLHDPCVIAWLLKPELFGGRHINVTVETASELTMGMTVADWWGVTKRPKNVTYMRDIDHEGFFNLLVERLGRL